MKLPRRSTALICGALVVLGAPAEAKSAKPTPAPKPAKSCRLVTDPAGDANGISVGAPAPSVHAGPSIDALDILSIDLGTGNKTMVWLMQVKKLSVTSASAPSGMFWAVRFTIRRTTFTASAHSDLVGGISYDLSYASAAGGGTVPGALVGTFDRARSQLRLTVRVATIAGWEPAPLSAKITGIGGTTGQEILTRGMSAYTGSSAPPDASDAVDWTTGDVSRTPGRSGCKA